jgi:hypothetical protein
MAYLIALFLEGRCDDFWIEDQKLITQYGDTRGLRFADDVHNLFLMCNGGLYGLSDYRRYFEPVLMIGDQMAAAFNNIRVKMNGRFMNIASHAIPRLSIEKLATGNDGGFFQTGKSAAFWDSIDCVGRYAGLVLNLGTYDCEVVIPKMRNRCQVRGVLDGVMCMMNCYREVIQKIRRKAGDIPIFVVPAFPRFPSSSTIVHLFNMKLRDRLCDGVRILNLFKGMGPLAVAPVDSGGVPTLELFNDFVKEFAECASS